MKSFREYLEERLQDPVKLALRVARRYGTKDQKYSGMLAARRSEHIPLKSYRARTADSVFSRYERVRQKIGGKDIESPKKEIRDPALQKVEDSFEKKTMNISDLHPTQLFVHTRDVEQLQRKIDDKNPSHVRVATHKGNFYIIDGHHSVMAARLRGEKTIDVGHLDLDKYR
jgi:hypothetical protein